MSLKYGQIYDHQLVRWAGWTGAEIAMAVYVRASKHASTEGLSQIPTAYVAYDRQWDIAEVDRLLDRLVQLDDIARDGDWVLVLDALEHHALRTEAHLKGAANRLKGAPVESSIYTRFIAGVRKSCPKLLPYLAEPSGVAPEYHSDGTHEELESSSSNSTSNSTQAPAQARDARAAAAPNLTVVENSLDQAVQRLVRLAKQDRFVDPRTDGGDGVLLDAITQHGPEVVNAALDHIVAWASDSKPLQQQHLSRLFPTALDKVRQSKAVETSVEAPASSMPSFEQAFESVDRALNRNRYEPLPTIQDLLDSDPAAAQLYALSGDFKTWGGNRSTFEFGQWKRDLRSKWTSSVPDPTVAGEVLRRLIVNHNHRVLNGAQGEPIEVPA